MRRLSEATLVILFVVMYPISSSVPSSSVILELVYSLGELLGLDSDAPALPEEIEKLVCPSCN